MKSVREKSFHPVNSRNTVTTDYDCNVVYFVEQGSSNPIYSFLQKNKRQLMNITYMPKAYWCIAKTKQNEIIGIMGIDINTSSLPETFSHFVTEPYRFKKIGCHLEYLVSLIAKKFYAERIFLRSSSRDHIVLKMKREKDPSFSVLNDFNDFSKDLCSKCAFFQQECVAQSFFLIDLNTRLQTLEIKLSTQIQNKLKNLVENYFNASE